MPLETQTFESLPEWIEKSAEWLKSHESYKPRFFEPICFDSSGRACLTGADIGRAHVEGKFPVRWLWPDEISRILDNKHVRERIA